MSTPSGRTLAATGAATAACAAAGSVASAAGVKSGWYARLKKPSFQPPGAVFGPVWTVLFGDLAVTSAVALEALDKNRAAGYRTALGVNLVLNASWSWTFFRFHRLFPAVLVAGALSASSVDLVRRTWAADRRAGAALAPYAGWCTFATLLSTALWHKNR